MSTIPLAVPDAEVGPRFFGYDPAPKDRNRLRKRGHWPPNFYIGGQSFVLVADIERCLAERKAAAEDERARHSAQTTAAVRTRWHGKIATGDLPTDGLYPSSGASA